MNIFECFEISNVLICCCCAKPSTRCATQKTAVTVLTKKRHIALALPLPPPGRAPPKKNHTKPTQRDTPHPTAHQTFSKNTVL
jgi:hypothetical protein